MVSEAKKERPWIFEKIVLILVVVEEGLRVDYKFKGEEGDLIDVLILVVVEDGLRV